MRFSRICSCQSPRCIFGVGSGSHAEQTGNVINSTLACALVGAKEHIPVAHLEAGLRSGDRTMPEEINRVATDAIVDLLWTPSIDGDEHLLAEGVPAERIERIGNIMIDSVELMRPKIEATGMAAKLNLKPGSYGVVTLHRPSQDLSFR